MQNGRKLNRLQSLLPQGFVADASWLEAQGYSRTLRSKYVAQGWLEQAARGVYCRPGGLQCWEQVVVSLQSLMRLPVAVGGGTALHLQGYAHYLPIGGEPEVQLYTEVPLPGWLGKLDLRTSFEAHNASRLLPAGGIAQTIAALPLPASTDFDPADLILGQGLRALSWGQPARPLVVSTAERAILEMIDELPKGESFENVDAIMEGLGTLSPRRLQTLLEACRSIKVKRLFLWFAERHGHPWLKQVDTERVNIGSGKRVIAKGGRLDSRYQITVPETLHGDK